MLGFFVPSSVKQFYNHRRVTLQRQRERFVVSAPVA